MAVLAVNIGDIMKGAMIMGYEYIEKAAILSKCEELWNNADETTQTGVDTINTIDRITDFIEAMPAADVQPIRRGRWIISDDVEHFIAVCSECGRTEDSRDIKDMPYCHCGADMRNDSNLMETEVDGLFLNFEQGEGQ